MGLEAQQGLLVAAVAALAEALAAMLLMALLR
jgi:hypothetical protein